MELRLARDLGLTLWELRERLTGEEFALWVGFYVREARAMERGRKKG